MLTYDESYLEQSRNQSYLCHKEDSSIIVKTQLHAFVSLPLHVDQIVDLLCVLVSNLRVTVDIEQHI